MTRAVQFTLFFALAILVTAGLHRYVYIRLIRGQPMSAGVRQVALGVLIGLFALMLISMPLSRVLPREVASPLMWVCYTWMGVLLLLSMVLGAGDLLRLLVGAAVPLHPPDPERRVLLARISSALTLGTTTALASLALGNALRAPTVRRLTLRLPRLPGGLDGLRVVQLSDLHIGPTIDGEWLRGVVAQVNALAPDIVAITGDLVDGSVRQLGVHVAPLADLRARHGVYFVTGNHEYYSGVSEWIAELGRLGVRVLRNERVTIAAGDGSGKALYLAGVDDFHSHRFAGHGADLGRALRGRDLATPVLLLAHQPAAIEEAARLGVDLQLSGHTHGGQIWPWGYLVRLQQPYVSGLHRHRGTLIYVSNGTGYWGPPMRLRSPAEITHITLVSGAASGEGVGGTATS